MTIIFALINFAFSYMMWSNAVADFEKKENRWGWFCLVGSAFNFAAGSALLIMKFS